MDVIIVLEGPKGRFLTYFIVEFRGLKNFQIATLAVKLPKIVLFK